MNNDHPLFELVFSACSLVVRQYLLLKKCLSYNLVLGIWEWHSEYLLFETVFLVSRLVGGQYLLLQNGLPDNLVLRIWGW